MANIVMPDTKVIVKDMLGMADIVINGTRPWDMRVLDERLYSRVLSNGSLGLGEAYMDGWWETDRLDEFFARILSANVDRKIKVNIQLALAVLSAKMFNRQNGSKAFEIGEKHYDIGNDLYSAMLGNRMVYTCGYWKDATNLDDAQEAKLHVVCKKIGLKQGQRVLDIGCGWGSFAKFASEKYGARVVGISVSREQVKFAKDRCDGLPVEIRFQDYRDVTETFDHVISLGMFEHVGYKNYRTFMEVVSRVLCDGGIFLLHTIGGNISAVNTDPWIEKYIFPKSMLPSIAQIGHALEGIFVMEDWHNFGADYDKTLMAWFENIKNQWDTLKSGYSDRFFRMWKYYLLSCAGSFRCRRNQLWQIVLTKSGIRGGYARI